MVIGIDETRRALATATCSNSWWCCVAVISTNKFRNAWKAQSASHRDMFKLDVTNIYATATCSKSMLPTCKPQQHVQTNTRTKCPMKFPHKFTQQKAQAFQQTLTEIPETVQQNLTEHLTQSIHRRWHCPGRSRPVTWALELLTWRIRPWSPALWIHARNYRRTQRGPLPDIGRCGAAKYCGAAFSVCPG